MDYNDRIVVFDENGQPFIAHAWFNRKGSTKKDHKYLMKIGEGAKARYLYTQQEVQAYLRGGKQKIQKTVDKKLKAPKEKYEKAQDDTDRAYKKYAHAVNQYNHDVKKIYETVDNYNNNKYNPINRRKRGEEVLDARAAVKRSAINMREKESDLKASMREHNDALSEYNSSLGKKLNDIKGLPVSVKADLKNKVDKVADAVKDTWGVDEKEEVLKAIDERNTTRKKLKEAKKELEDAQRNFRLNGGIVKKALQPKKYEELRQKVSDAEKKYSEAETNHEKAVANKEITAAKYDKTPMGKLESAGITAGIVMNNLGLLIGDARDAVADVVGYAIYTAANEIDRNKEINLKRKRREFIDKSNDQFTKDMNLYVENMDKINSKYVYDPATNERVSAESVLSQLVMDRDSMVDKYAAHEGGSEAGGYKVYEDLINAYNNEFHKYIKELSK